MPTQSKCSYCDPPGSGSCKECQNARRSGTTNCPTCYGTGKCRHCYGTGFELTTMEKTRDVFLWLWWISWFGLIGAFLFVGFWEYRVTSSVGSSVSHFCLMLLTITILLWALFFALDNKARAKTDSDKNWKSLVILSTLAGTILAIYTLVGIFFFIYIAPRVH
jgi:hypothetical protein